MVVPFHVLAAAAPFQMLASMHILAPEVLGAAAMQQEDFATNTNHLTPNSNHLVAMQSGSNASYLPPHTAEGHSHHSPPTSPRPMKSCQLTFDCRALSHSHETTLPDDLIAPVRPA